MPQVSRCAAWKAVFDPTSSRAAIPRSWCAATGAHDPCYRPPLASSGQSPAERRAGRSPGFDLRGRRRLLRRTPQDPRYRRATRFEAIELIRQGVRVCFLGIAPSPGFVREPRAAAAPSAAFALKEDLPGVRRVVTIEEPRTPCISQRRLRPRLSVTVPCASLTSEPVSLAGPSRDANAISQSVGRYSG